MAAAEHQAVGNMNLRRLLTHLFTSRWHLHRLFPPNLLQVIEAEIAASERGHLGEIRLAVEAALDIAPLLNGITARERAIEVFSHLHVWDTERNNGVLIYLLLADRDVEIVADRGINGLVDGNAWEAICHEMEDAFRQGDFEMGSIAGIKAIANHLMNHFPADHDKRNELPDKPVVL